MGKTNICRAKTRFLEEVVRIPEVVQVVTHGGETTAERSILVFVPSLESETAQTVFALQGQILREYPGARLDVEVDGLLELGLTADTLGDWVPEGANVLHPKSNVPARQLATAAR
jgi:hypothetical protein